ncbi:hypothetical protein AN639_06525 [Candidatus Epulonipiscium fishelsonii]|uniref:Uncharacterized protein n=1 Tax=Candidatus Epulonipiscium fishelsonii TaxID=77094 RepID=A0ACC8XC31_9FIRM|nr:hypothetical protein AN639_06525 [Epulopiscium sp. SCG-B05WGA-EpuloA1]ONI40415.1 hypothetical protein AN396_06295 [Epulopiscium sp. SCG-B11WGA-EpuloA1]
MFTQRTRRILVLHKKTILISVGVIISILIIGSYFVGNYFVEYVLGRKPVNFDDPLSPTYDKPTVEQINRDIAKEKVKDFYNNISFEEVTIPSTDGKETLYAKIFPQENSNLWVVLVHGYTSSHKDIEDVIVEYYNRGYNVVAPDLRSHGNSTGEYITLGEKDKDDIVAWANYINNSESKIVLHGFSMGAATVLLASSADKLPESVFAIIEDSGYTTALQMLNEQLTYRFNLPTFPIIDISNIVSIIKTGLNFYDPKPIEAIQNSELPILFIHGDEDIFVLPYMHTELYNTYKGPKDKLMIGGAGHTAGRYVEPQLYYDTVFNFIETYT